MERTALKIAKKMTFRAFGSDPLFFINWVFHEPGRAIKTAVWDGLPVDLQLLYRTFHLTV